ncbi:galactokinase [Mucilaginibacter sp. ZT4R22]|uniref:Galactokinase n=1 Tax=Mucilaginibacter pankratovii TaxID=2772110 RepID=A0ABR7WLN9_9SPHI|nr:galactokinase family protein [Mucilaginibacter pankratovii]MBD1363234.1 galactokinase [Mucilaginibacter pankratovii]
MANITAAAEFNKLFNKQPVKEYFCPGWVNLLGEHTVQNGGFLISCAVGMGTYLLLALNNDGLLRLRSLNYQEALDIPIGVPYREINGLWYNKSLAVLSRFSAKGHQLTGGLDILYFSDLPFAMELISTSSIEIVTAFGLNELFNTNFSKDELMNLADLYTGKISWLAATHSVKDAALLINGQTGEHNLVSLNLGDYCLAIISAKRQRSQSESVYNERAADCNAALACLQPELGIDNLCQIDTVTLHWYKYLITDENIFKRALHVVEENDRVKAAAELLAQGDMEAFGELMYQSHQSLKNLYGVSSVELDTIAEYCRFYKGVIGARMAGYGFGSGVIALVKTDAFAGFKEDMISYYTDLIGYPPTVHQTSVGSGIEELIKLNSQL